MGKPKVSRVPKVENPTKFKIFVDSESCIPKIQYPLLNSKETRKKVIRKPKEFKDLEKGPKIPKSR